MQELVKLLDGPTAVELLDDAMVSRRPLLWKIGEPVVRRLAKPWQERMRRLDASEFVRAYRYEVFLFRAADTLEELWRRKRARA